MINNVETIATVPRCSSSRRGVREGRTARLPTPEPSLLYSRQRRARGNFEHEERHDAARADLRHRRAAPGRTRDEALIPGGSSPQPILTASEVDTRSNDALPKAGNDVRLRADQ